MPEDTVVKILPDPTALPDWTRHEIPAQPPAHDPDENPSRCYRINTDYIPFLIALCGYYAWPDAFTGDEAAQILASERFRELQVLLMQGNIDCLGESTMYLLRQSPYDSCVLEQSIDGGTSWTTAFDYRLCFAQRRQFSDPETQDIIINNNIDLGTLLTQYQGVPTNIFADGTFDQGPDDAIRNAAMCYALNLLIIDLSKMVADRLDNGTDWVDIIHFVATGATYVGGLILGIFGSTLISTKPEWFFVVSLVTAASKWAADFTDAENREPDLAPLLDSDLQQALICCAMGVLEGNTPTTAIFASMFQTCSIPDLNPDIESLLNYLTESEDVYLSFLQMCQSSFDAVKDGQTFNCGCGEDLVGWDFDNSIPLDNRFVHGQGSTIVLGYDAGCGAFVELSGWIQGNETTGQFTKHRGTAIRCPGVTGTVSRVKVYYDISLSNYLEYPPGTIIYGGDQREFSIVEVGNGDDRTQERVASRVLNNEPIDIRWYCYIKGTDNPQWAGTVTLKRVEVYGAGLSIT
jgi:hypothetical protein